MSAEIKGPHQSRLRRASFSKGEATIVSSFPSGEGGLREAQDG
jgi:hypothetical protein